MKIATITPTDKRVGSFDLYYIEKSGAITRFPDSPYSGWPVESRDKAIEIVKAIYSGAEDFTYTIY